LGHTAATDPTTIKPSQESPKARSGRVPSLTILFHPEDPTRAGEIARLWTLLAEGACGLSRLEPEFAAPGGTRRAPLGDRHLSRTPVRISRRERGVRLEPAGSELRVDGVPLGTARDLSRDELEQGVILELGGRVVLLLHLLGPELPRQPRLGMVGDSEAIERLRSEILRVADMGVAVLLCGESGTGKECAARALAAIGSRAKGPFVAVNLAAVPSSIATSELFGHVAGAFTGAEGPHAGFFAEANGGTLFLDEIGAATLDVQAMLLRALESGEIQPLGSDRRRLVDVRVLAATDEDLELAVGEGRFREALYHRLSGYELDVAPLRRRRDDFGRLFMHFLGEELRAIGEERRTEELAAPSPWLPPALVARMARYDWPGNVRQLANVVRRLVVASRAGGSVSEEALPARVLEWTTARAAEPAAERAPSAVRASVGEEELRSALRDHAWRINATARALGISRTYLYTLIDRSTILRKAKDVTAEEIRTCHDACAGDVDAMVEQLKVSSRGIRLRLKELGLA
jgi:two-component system nitrogen regulation response regulator GlnG